MLCLPDLFFENWELPKSALIYKAESRSVIPREKSAFKNKHKYAFPILDVDCFLPRKLWGLLSKGSRITKLWILFWARTSHFSPVVQFQNLLHVGPLSKVKETKAMLEVDAVMVIVIGREGNVDDKQSKNVWECSVWWWPVSSLLRVVGTGSGCSPTHTEGRDLSVTEQDQFCPVFFGNNLHFVSLLNYFSLCV